jgi:hypothetical protein
MRTINFSVHVIVSIEVHFESHLLKKNNNNADDCLIKIIWFFVAAFFD